MGDSRSSNTVEYDKDAQIAVYANLVFEAVWKDRSYTVHFAAGNSQAGGTMADAITGVEYELPECGFTPPANRKFYKWKYNGELYDEGDTITIKDGFVKTTEITLTAVWQSDASDTAGVITIKNVVPPVDGNLPDETFGLMEGEHTHATTLAELTDVYKSRYPELLDAQNETMAQVEIENYSGWSKIVDSDTTYYYKYGQDYWPSGTGYVKDNKYRFMLYVTADSGYVFDSSDLSVVPEKLMENTDYDSAKTTFVTGSNNTIVKVELYFTAKKATMDVSFDANGGEGTMETVPVATGSEYTLPACTFTAPEGKEFDRWQIDSAFFEAGSKITVKEDLNLKAVWATDVAPSYIVKVTDDGLGTASASATEAKKGTVVTLTQTPNAGQTFKRWIVMSCPDGVDITVAADGTFTMPEGDVEIMACFHDHDYTENADAKYLKYPAGCTGKAVYYKSCSVCGIRGEETFEYGEPLGHTWVDPAGVQTIDPGCTEFGELTFTCSVCGMKETEKINPLGHDWNAAVYEWSADNSQVTASHICKRNAGHTETETVNTKVTGGTATCEAAETADFEAEFVNPDFAKQTKTANVEALGHDWGEPSYVWNADNSQVTATRICKRDDSHKETETVDTTSTNTATCEAAGKITYEAVFENTVFAKQIKEADSDALGHDWGEWTEITPATETAPGEEQRVCKRDATHVEKRVIPPLNHVHIMIHHARVEATATAPGSIEYWECSECHRYFSDSEGKTEISLESTVIPAGGTTQDPDPTPKPENPLKDGEIYISAEDAAIYMIPAVTVKDVPVSAAMSGTTIAFTVEYDYLNAVTYTGSKILPETALEVELSLDDLMAQVTFNEGVSLTAKDVFKVTYVKANNKEASRKKKATFYAKLAINKGINKQMSKAEYKKLKKLVSQSNKALKKNKCEFTINPKPITDCTPELVAKFNKDGTVKVAKKTGLLSGVKGVWVTLAKRTKLAKSTYTLDVPVTAEDGKVTVKVTGKKNYTGTAVVEVKK